MLGAAPAGTARVGRRTGIPPLGKRFGKCETRSVHRVRRTAVVASVALGAVVVSVASAARPDGFRDDFTTLDTRQWVTITRPFGHGAVDAANVAVASGLLGIKLPAGRLDGGEVRSAGL